MGFLTGTILTLFILTCLFLVLLVMVQTGKGNSGGILGGASASQSPFGASTADVLTKMTRVTAVLFVVFSLTLSFLFAKKEEALIPELPASIQESPEKTNE